LHLSHPWQALIDRRIVGSGRGLRTGRTGQAGAVAIRNVAGTAATPAAGCGNSRRAIFIAPVP